MSKTVIKISFKRIFDYIKHEVDKINKEDDMFYRGLCDHILIDLLETQDLSGEQSEAFKDAVDTLIQYGFSDEEAKKLCTDMADIGINLLEAHIPDLDNPKYSDMKFEILEDVDVYITY